MESLLSVQDASPIHLMTTEHACPRCGSALLLVRSPRAALLRCPAQWCHARLRIRGGRVELAA